MVDFNNISSAEHKKLLKVIMGALKSCISTHGPITSKWVGSAGKRVIGGLKSYDKSKPEKEKSYDESME